MADELNYNICIHPLNTGYLRKENHNDLISN